MSCLPLPAKARTIMSSLNSLRQGRMYYFCWSCGVMEVLLGWFYLCSFMCVHLCRRYGMASLSHLGFGVDIWTLWLSPFVGPSPLGGETCSLMWWSQVGIAICGSRELQDLSNSGIRSYIMSLLLHPGGPNKSWISPNSREDELQSTSAWNEVASHWKEA